MKKPKECKNIEQLMEVEVDVRSKLIIKVVRLETHLTLLQRTLELFASNPTEDLKLELEKQYGELNDLWGSTEINIAGFFTDIKDVMEMRNELAPRMIMPQFGGGLGPLGLGGMNPGS